jgi:lipopolysaccharide export system permease protein
LLLLKYFNREVVHSMIAIIVILLLIVISNMFIRYLSMAAGGNFPGMTVFKFIGILLPKYIAYLLPISLFFSILIIYGKLFSNSELMVYFSCGGSWMNLLKITLIPTLFIFIIEAALTTSIVPFMVKNFNILKQAANQTSPVEYLSPGKITQMSNGKEIIYIGGKDSKKNTLKNIFIYTQDKTGADVIITAPKGYTKTSQKGTQYITLTKGKYYKKNDTTSSIQLSTFKTASQYISGYYNISEQQDYESMPFLSLFKYNNTKASAEIQWRLFFPISVLVTMFIALAVCKINPRTSRFQKIIPAVIIFIIYFNLATLSRTWIEDKHIPIWIGIWWVHIVFLGTSFLYILKMNGSFLKQQEKVNVC